MKTISLKLDDFVVDLLNEESEEKKVTRMEIIRSAVIHYLLNRDDAGDLNYIQKHKKDKLISFEETFTRAR